MSIKLLSFNEKHGDEKRTIVLAGNLPRTLLEELQHSVECINTPLILVDALIDFVGRRKKRN